MSDERSTRNACKAAESQVTDEFRARAWTNGIWEDPDDEYAKVLRLIADIRRDERKACATRLDAAEALLARAHGMLEGSTRVLEHEIAAFLWPDKATDSVSKAADSQEKAR